jgi:hypothetical protein
MIDIHDRAAVCEPLRHGVVQRGLGLYVKPGPGFIENEQPPAGQQRLRDGHLLAHAL